VDEEFFCHRLEDFRNYKEIRFALYDEKKLPEVSLSGHEVSLRWGIYRLSLRSFFLTQIVQIAQITQIVASLV
jgi:hypothetical protein